MEILCKKCCRPVAGQNEYCGACLEEAAERHRRWNLPGGKDQSLPEESDRVFCPETPASTFVGGHSNRIVRKNLNTLDADHDAFAKALDQD